MPTRENQGLQISLILFVMITVVLAVTTYIYWKRGEDFARARQASDDAKAAVEGELASLKAEFGEFKSLLGYAPDAKRAEIDANYRAEMALFSESYQGPRNYRTLAPVLVDEVVKRSEQLTEARTLQAGLETKITVVRAEENGLKNQAIDAHQKLAAELARLREVAATDRARITADQTALAKQLEQETLRAAAAQEEARKQLAKLSGDLHKSEQLVVMLKKNITELRGETSTDGADGQVVHVDQTSHIVQINAGEADGLRRLMTFSVVDRDATTLKGTRVKATIEVTTLLESHLAEARIVSDDIRNPILTGDQFFSPVWARGQKLRFALAGFLDLDGDGRSDRARIKAMITQSGGEVTAEATDEGKQIGQVDIDTRYLVVGQAPTDKTRPEAIAAFSAITSEASRLGIEQLSLPRLLGFLQRENRTTYYGSQPAARPEPTPARIPPAAKGAFQ